MPIMYFSLLRKLGIFARMNNVIPIYVKLKYQSKEMKILFYQVLIQTFRDCISSQIQLYLSPYTSDLFVK